MAHCLDSECNWDDIFLGKHNQYFYSEPTEHHLLHFGGTNCDTHTVQEGSQQLHCIYLVARRAYELIKDTGIKFCILTSIYLSPKSDVRSIRK